MDLASLKPTPGSKHKKKREARGRAGYGGKTAGRGHNGQGQRAGRGARAQFEGGQTPLYRRLPKRQYNSLPNRKFFTVLNLSHLESLDLAEITPETLLAAKVVKKLGNAGLKILAYGELTKPIKIKAHAFSEAAKEKITAAGGSFEELGS